MSFTERARLNYLKQNFGRIKWYYDDIKNTATGNFVNTANEYELAK